MNEAIKNVATLIMGQSPPGSTYNELGEGVPFYQGVRDFGERYPMRRVYCIAPTRFAKADDVLFSVRAPIGEINRATEDCSIGRGLAAIRADSYLDTTYIEYVLRYVRREWEVLEGQGAVFGNAKKSDLENLPVPWPGDEERRAIAHILGSLDDKIELNRRMNETLEAMARAIFKSWFVDFLPVRAKQRARTQTGDPVRACRGEPVCSPTKGADTKVCSYMTPEILNLFPDSFEDSELGEIPKGWKIEPLENVCSRITDGSHYSPKTVSNGKSMASVKDMHNWGFNLGTCRMVSEEEYQKLVRNDCRPLKHDVLIAKDGSYLKHIFVVEKGLDIVILSSIAILRPNDRINSHLLAYSLKTDSTMARMERYVSGAVLQRIVLKDFKKFPIILPSIEIQHAWSTVINPIIQLCWDNVHESETISALRDSLLPKLISGELEVPEIDGLVEQSRLEAQPKSIIYTIGHSNHSTNKFIDLLKQHCITAVADVRSVPYSRFNPQFNKEELDALLKSEGIAYVFLGKELGARPNDRSCYNNGQVDFSCMAERVEFKGGLDRVIKGSEEYRVALMCAEKEPLDCHRTILVCRNLKTRGVSIKHILADGALEDHRDTEGRLLALTQCERSIFDQGVSDSEIIERAYKKRAQDIAHKENGNEVHHD
ncbi:MAG: DUF488 family protein [Chloroflexota bacterium]|nr:DUF488 family protein [Chloroflexota bacterium]